METNVKAMSIEQLKAIAYDQIELAEKCRANILTIQMEIKARENPTMPAPAHGDKPTDPPAPPLEVK